MKIRNLVFFGAIVVILLFPAGSWGMMLAPIPNLTVIVNTQEEDSTFDFNLTYCSTNIAGITTCSKYDQFNLETQNLTASQSVFIFPGGKYYVSEKKVSGWKIDSIFCTSENPETLFLYTQNGVSFSPIALENIICVFNNVKAPAKTPVLIVPGLVGTEMKKGNELLWADLGRMLSDIGDSFLDALSFSVNLTSNDSLVSIADVIRKLETGLGLVKYDYSEGLINEFKGQDYVGEENLFTFPYDWRYGVSGVMPDGKINSDLLGEKINEILQQTGADKLDIVAHSMGGLIVKKYVMDNSADNKISKAVFVGVPNTGTPKAFKGLLQGDNFGIPWLYDSEIKKISENMPSAYDLLPSQQYYDIKGSFVETIYLPELTDENPSVQSIAKNLNYEETKSFLTDSHGLNSLALSNAESLHTQSFDNFDMRTAGVDLYAIDGCKAATLSKIAEITNESFGSSVEYRGIKFTPGDNTVPLESATNLPINQNNKYYALVAEHGKMLSQDGVRQEIVNLVSGSELSTNSVYIESVITQDISNCQLNGKAISVFSPINIFVTDQDGNKLGLAEDGSIINEILNADFEIWGEHKFVYLPTDGGQIYNVNINGTDSGIYTIKTEDIQNSQIGITEVFSNLPVTAQLLGQLDLSAGTTTLSLDVDGDGTTDQSISPSAVLGSDQADDLIPPASEATIVGEKKKPAQKIIFWLRGKKQNTDETGIQVDIIATDDNSGVLAVWYNLDNAGYQKIDGDKAQVDVTGDGEHTILFFSTDKAGNNETEQSLGFEIKGNKNKFKVFFTEIKNLMYNKAKINIDQDKTKFPWNLGKMTKDAKHSAQKPILPNILDSLKNKFKFSWVR